MDPDERERLRQADTTSRSEIRAEKRDSLNRRETLAKTLAALDDRKLVRLELEPGLLEEVRLFARLRKGSALARQRRHVVRALGEHDVDEIERRLAVLSGDVRRDATHHRLQRLVDQLLEQGDAAFGDFLEQHPGANRQQLRQALRAAQKEQIEGKTKRRREQLYRLLREA
jgi:ribosome-associated protein